MHDCLAKLDHGECTEVRDVRCRCGGAEEGSSSDVGMLHIQLLHLKPLFRLLKEHIPADLSKAWTLPSVLRSCGEVL